MASACQRLAAHGRHAGQDFGAVLRRFLPGFLAAHHRFPKRKARLLQRLAACRSGAFGHGVYRCAHCGRSEIIPLGCGDRHCPSCQAVHAKTWLHNQLRWLLPVPYFHVVFTLPHQLLPLLLYNQSLLYKLFFDAAAQSLLDFARSRLAGTPGITAVLHTWGQKLNYHPHLHCLVTGGALASDGHAWHPPKQKRYLFPEAALAALFRGKFLAGLRTQGPHLRIPDGFAWSRVAPLYKMHWQVYFKRPFGGPKQVLSYLAQYTHRVAIANSRIRQIDTRAGTVTITYRDYADAGKVKLLQLPGVELIRRFSRHLLPLRFAKIRHYGILSNNRKSRDILQARLLLRSRAALQNLLAPAPRLQPKCPDCRTGSMYLMALRLPHGAFTRAPLRIDSS